MLTRVIAALVRVLGGATLVVLAGGCSFDRGPDIESATTFDRFPIYWLGAEFEGRELSHVEAEDWSTAAVPLSSGASSREKTDCVIARREIAKDIREGTPVGPSVVAGEEMGQVR